MRKKLGRDTLIRLLARQNIPSDFSYEGVACKLEIRTIFPPIFASNI